MWLWCSRYRLRFAHADQRGFAQDVAFYVASPDKLKGPSFVGKENAAQIGPADSEHPFQNKLQQFVKFKIAIKRLGGLDQCRVALRNTLGAR